MGVRGAAGDMATVIQTKLVSEIDGKGHQMKWKLGKARRNKKKNHRVFGILTPLVHRCVRSLLINQGSRKKEITENV